jgi:hypothetical protein
MGLKEDLQRTVQNVINTSVDNIPVQVTIVQMTKVEGTDSGKYSPSQPSKEPIPISCVIDKAFVLNFRDREVDGVTIKTGDRKILFATLDAPSLCPEIDDKVIIEDIHYKVVTVKTDPVKATWTLQVRR